MYVSGKVQIENKPSWVVRIGGTFLVLCILLAIYGTFFMTPKDLRISSQNWIPGIIFRSSGTWFVTVENTSKNITYKDLVFGLEYYAESGTRVGSDSHTEYVALGPGEERQFVFNGGGGSNARRGNIEIKRAKRGKVKG